MQTVIDPRTAVTPEVFAAAKTYEEYVASIERNREKFADNLEKTIVPEATAARLRELVGREGGPARVLVIGEDWCPDVFRGMPVMKRIADAAGIEMRVLERDQHLDVMQHFKMAGEFDSIPVFVFLTADGRYVAHWVERPARANDEMREAMSPIFGPSGMRALTEKYGREPTEAERAAAKAEAQDRYEEFQRSSPFWTHWREYTVEDVLELLEGASG